MNVDAQTLVTLVAAVLLAIILFRRVVGKGIKLAVRTALWGGALALLSGLGGPLGVNLVNALVLGVLGVPGLGLLMALSFVTG